MLSLGEGGKWVEGVSWEARLLNIICFIDLTCNHTDVYMINKDKNTHPKKQKLIVYWKELFHMILKHSNLTISLEEKKHKNCLKLFLVFILLVTILLLLFWNYYTHIRIKQISNC